ncbi:Protein dcg1 [Recurvomyces mirabilis]|uniref:Protein dcg1 n=1 Tax=Recurvomyces mirabilis TaxID=574656 RepID=A0AAE0TSI5_9PEZI|nr:Protein dcg1 [Recurvomyces mirabilis]KAK5159788.1 dal80p-controlled protein [Recurvomyces mirabilis]
MAATSKSGHSILIVNPNTTQSMTDALKPIVNSLGYNTQNYTYFTAPTGVPSINSTQDGTISTEACYTPLLTLLETHDAVLIACYSGHPLVPALRTYLSSLPATTSAVKCRYITGILETSIAACLPLLSQDQKFGIVSTGAQWEGLLNSAVRGFLGVEASTRFAGTVTTGLNANELHEVSKEDLDRSMKGAVGELLGRGVGAICLGCAGMAGLEEVVREACVERLGGEKGRRIMIVDGVASGVVLLEGVLRSKLY